MGQNPSWDVCKPGGQLQETSDLCDCQQVLKQASWMTPPPLPQSLPAPTIRKTVPEHQSPLRQTAQQLFPPGCESPELRSPRPPLKPHANPYLLKHGPSPPPQPYHTKEKTVWTFFVQFKCATHRWVGLYKPPVVTHSPLCTRHFSHTAVCTQSHKRLSNICMFTCSCTTTVQIISHCSPASCWLTMFLSAHVQYLCEAFA